jgi:hypothetical protein
MAYVTFQERDVCHFIIKVYIFFIGTGTAKTKAFVHISKKKKKRKKLLDRDPI